MDYLKDWLYKIVSGIAYIHDSILHYAGTLPVKLTDKDLHFVVFGLFGLALLLLALPLFRLLTRLGKYGLMAWLFTFSTVLMVCFAVEIGQYMTNTGSLQLSDIVYGIYGFLVVSAIVGLLYLLVCAIRSIFKRDS